MSTAPDLAQHAPPAAPPSPLAADSLRAIRDVAATLAGLAAFVYVTGGATLAARLGRGHLPSTTVVPQLPREFLISQGLLIVIPALAAGALAYAITVGWLRRHDRKVQRAAPQAPGDHPSDEQTGEPSAATEPQQRHWWQKRTAPRWIAGITTVVVFAFFFGLFSLKSPFAGHVCLTNGATVSGVLIGEASQRTYLGEPPSGSFSRIISIPQSQIAALYVGGPRKTPAPCGTLRAPTGG